MLFDVPRRHGSHLGNNRSVDELGNEAARVPIESNNGMDEEIVYKWDKTTIVQNLPAPAKIANDRLSRSD